MCSKTRYKLRYNFIHYLLLYTSEIPLLEVRAKSKQDFSSQKVCHVVTSDPFLSRKNKILLTKLLQLNTGFIPYRYVFLGHSFLSFFIVVFQLQPIYLILKIDPN